MIEKSNSRVLLFKEFENLKPDYILEGFIKTNIGYKKSFITKEATRFTSQNYLSNFTS